jgi:hypothetical protein
MNPRLFCRESAYHKALLLTFSFDPVFFEQVVLPDLWAGRSSDIVAIGDREQIEASTQAAAGHLCYLGRNYVLARANHAGAFHPKVFLRVGPKDGAIMIGSGNVTSSGWGGNQELGTAWMIGPDYPDKGEWLHQFLEDVLSWCDNELEKDAVRRLKDVPWLSLTPSATDKVSPILYSRHSLALGPQLARRWEGRQFEEVKILTGSSDESGAFLRWAHTTFGIRRATVALTPSMASFQPDKLANLPLELRLIEAPADRPLHAKFYWFEGADSTAAVMGSANCSAAAWLLPPEQRGNVETIVVYDAPDIVEFENALSIFSDGHRSPSELLMPKHTEAPEKSVARPEYELKGLRWSRSERSLEATISPSPSEEATVELMLSGQQFKMSAVGNTDGYWRCNLSEGMGKVTVFAFVKITLGDQTWCTLPCWIDDLMTLEHASKSARLIEPFKDLDRSTSSSEQRAMLDDLQDVARTLFHETASFRDPAFGNTRKDKPQPETTSAPINPQDLVLHLEEHHDSLRQLGSPHAETLSITGILRLLFESEDESRPSNGAKDDEDLDEDDPRGETRKYQIKEKATKDPDVPIEDRFRDRLAQQISEFLSDLSSPSFAERCTATQMIQAISFPLAVALRGRKRGWVSDDQSEKWSLEIFSILFRGAGAGKGGLLHTVEQRYAENGHLDTFNEVVGDGTLWVVLVATLGNAQWHGIGTDIDKAVALREIFSASQLLASATQNRIGGLLGRIRIDDARKYVAEIAPSVSDLLAQIESLLRPIWEAEMKEQVARRLNHKAGDLLWRDKAGWAICLENADARYAEHIKVRFRGVEKNIMVGFYVNVSDLSGRISDLSSLVTRLRTASSAAA